MKSVRLSEVRKTYRSGNGKRNVVLSDVSEEIPGTRFTCLFGGNGCGKTTLLNLIAGLDEPDSGSIAIENDGRSDIAVGYVWQDYRNSLLPWVNVTENIAFPLKAKGLGQDERNVRATELLSDFMPDVDNDARCYELSGGQQQLACLLRAVVSEPDLMLLDEPFSALDQHRSWDLALFFESVWLKRQVPVILVSHDVDEAVLLGDDILLMSKSARGIAKKVTNPLPRPRNLSMLTSEEHLACRREVIDFLFGERVGPAGRQASSGPRTLADRGRS